MHVVIDEQNIIVGRRCRGIKEVKHRRFWAAHVNLKWSPVSFNMPWLYHVCNAKCFYANKDDLPEKIGRNHCLRIQNVHLWLMCVAQKLPRLSSLFTWSPLWDSREMNSNQLLWPNNKCILIIHLPWLAPCRKTMECIFGYHRDVKLLLLSMIPISFCLFFPSSRENLNPLRYILAGGMFCLFTHEKKPMKKRRRISRNPKNGNGPKYQKSFQTLALKLLKGC